MMCASRNLRVMEKTTFEGNSQANGLYPRNQRLSNEELEAKEMFSPHFQEELPSQSRSRTLSLNLSEILPSLVVKIIAVEERLEEVSLRVYLVYKFYIYSPFSSWTIFKRYNDFIELHKQVFVLLEDYPEYLALKNYEFPTRHWYWTRETVVRLRTESFLQYVERALKISILSPIMSHFIGLDEHYDEFLFDGTMSINNMILKPVSSSDVESEDTDQQDTATTTSGDHHASDCNSNFQSQNFKQSTPSPTTIKCLPTIQLQYISELLDNISGPCLFSNLPLTAQTQRYSLGYATYRDGWNMTTLYRKIGMKSPLILLIRLLGFRSLIGAYISCPLGPPSFEFKGNSDCFVFKLSDDTIEKYGARVCDPEYIECMRSRSDDRYSRDDFISQQRFSRHDTLVPNSSSLLINEEIDFTRNSDLKTGGELDKMSETGSDYSSTIYEFVYSNMEVILLGGSEKLGTNAIRLSNDLSVFSSGPSDTYHNPCLGAENFEVMKVADVEIITAVGLFG